MLTKKYFVFQKGITKTDNLLTAKYTKALVIFAVIFCNFKK